MQIGTKMDKDVGDIHMSHHSLKLEKVITLLLIVYEWGHDKCPKPSKTPRSNC